MRALDRFFLLLALVLPMATLPAPLLAQENDSKEPKLIIRNLQATNDVTSNYVRGIEISFELEYMAGKGLFKSDKLVMHLLDPSGLEVAARGPGEAYRDSKGYLVREYEVATPGRGESAITQISLFIPYYAIKLLGGTHELTPRLALGKLLGSNTKPVPVEFDGPETFTLEMPRMYRIRFRVSDLSVSPRNLDEQGWDGGGLVVSNPDNDFPDLEFTLTYKSIGTEDRFYTSDEIENSVTVRYAEPVPMFYIGEYDKVYLEVWDADGIAKADRIGGILLTKADIETIYNDGDELSFEKVNVLKLDTYSQEIVE